MYYNKKETQVILRSLIIFLEVYIITNNYLSNMILSNTNCLKSEYTEEQKLSLWIKHKIHLNTIYNTR